MPFRAPGSWLLSFVEIANAPHPSPFDKLRAGSLPPGEREFLVVGFAVGRHPMIFLKERGGNLVLEAGLEPARFLRSTGF